LEAKRREVLHGAAPGAAVIGLLVNSSFSDVETQLKDVPAAGRVLGVEITILKANSEREIEEAFATLVEQRVGALLVASSPFFASRREQLWHWRHAMRYPQFLNGRSSLRWAV